MTSIYFQRLRHLREHVADGDILIFSATMVPRSYPADTYAFHQDATFRYYTGLVIPDAALLIDAEGRETLFVTPAHPDEVIWTGEVPSPRELADQAAIEGVAGMADLSGRLSSKCHFIAPHDGHIKIRLASLLGIRPEALADAASVELRRAIIDQRNFKDASEIAEIESAIALTKRMIDGARAVIEPGRRESDVLAALLAPAIAEERGYFSIVTVRGDILHNTSYSHTIEPHHLLLIDCGTESAQGYCSDITRTYSATGNLSDLTAKQRGIYDAVLSSQHAAIAKTAQRGASQLDVHLEACRSLTASLQALGLMRGDIESSLREGAHALFLPHGIGHMLGLDVHDMENLGDDVGYVPGTRRSSQFGLNALRLARKLEPGYVITIEPGCYFIDALIDRWKATRHLEDFICYDEVEKYRGLGGVRIEDDILITETGSRVLGPEIEK